MRYHLPSPDPRYAAPSFVVLLADMQALFLSALTALHRNWRKVFVFLGAVGGVLLILWLLVLNDRAAERRALEQRLATLAAQPLVPGSALGCLDRGAGDALDAACERAVFASAASTAAALAYAEARIALLIDGDLFAREQDPRFAASIEPLRTALESDRFGTVSHVLQQRRQCTVARCDLLSLFDNPGRLHDNMRIGTFAALVARASEAWSEPGAAPPMATPAPPAVAAIRPPAAAPGTASADDELRPPPHAPLPPGYKLPSSDSIPPVSIMDPEPTTGSANGPGSGEPPAPRSRPARAAPSPTMSDPGVRPPAGASRASPQLLSPTPMQ